MRSHSDSSSKTTTGFEYVSIISSKSILIPCQGRHVPMLSHFEFLRLFSRCYLLHLYGYFPTVRKLVTRRALGLVRFDAPLSASTSPDNVSHTTNAPAETDLTGFSVLLMAFVCVSLLRKKRNAARLQIHTSRAINLLSLTEIE